MHLDARPLLQLKGIGPRVVGKLAKMGIHSVADLLFHLPFRYEDRTQVRPIGSLRPGQSVLIEGRVELAEVAFRRRRTLLVRVSDDTGRLLLRFFHFSAAQQSALPRGAWLRCFGEVRSGPSSLEMVHPEYQAIQVDQRGQVEPGLTPVYPVTDGVQQRSLRKWTDQALDHLEQIELPELLPESLIRSRHWPTLSSALQTLHRPSDNIDFQAQPEAMHPAHQRLVFEELVAHRVSLARLKQRQQAYSAPLFKADGPKRRQFLAQLPFDLTSAQQRVLSEISRDLQAGAPMQRLLQGDVGSGKTVISALAALMAHDAGYQAALMAPTELLAEQHRATLTDWLQPLGVQAICVTGKQKKSQREAQLTDIASGAAHVVVGTHALFQDEVQFSRLGLVMIDEQHRFGVHQRMALRDKGRQASMHPHQLVMTATPIPRTLAMLGYADLDLSVIDELPPGRTPVSTSVVSVERREEVIDRIRKGVADGRQVYWVCTLIEESETLQCQAAEDAATLLHQSLPDVRVGLVHGRMKSDEKMSIMLAFKAGELDLLVATTVIEVGVDVPNASLMVIENAERLGLSQLHQLRGRVGRGSTQSFCVLMYQPPLSQAGRERLAILRETQDGFRIADKDLQMRGPGELLGTRQAGAMRFKVADLARDEVMLGEVARVSSQIIQRQPKNVVPLIRRWLGDSVQYRDV